MPEIKLSDLKGYHTFESFASHPVTAVYSDRSFDLRFADEDPLATNRPAFCQTLDIPPGNLVGLEQIHGSNIMLVNGKMKGRGATHRSNALPKADGAIVREKGVPIGILTADCGSIFIYDAKAHAAGIAHVGWRGLAAGLAEKIVTAFSNNFLSRPKDLIVGLGPMIRKCCYEVQADVAHRFEDFLVHKNEKVFLDLAAGIKTSLMKAGIRGEAIEDCGHCTHCEEQFFFSFRRDGRTAGRMMALVMLR